MRSPKGSMVGGWDRRGSRALGDLRRPQQSSGRGFPAGPSPWAPPRPTSEPALTFSGLVHALIPLPGCDWSSRRATAPGSQDNRLLPAPAKDGWSGALEPLGLKQSSGRTFWDFIGSAANCMCSQVL